MAIIPLLIAVLIVGFAVWLIQTAPLPINSWFKNVIIGIIVIAFIIWLLNHFGLYTGIHIK